MVEPIVVSVPNKKICLSGEDTNKNLDEIKEIKSKGIEINQENLIIVWDILMQDFRTINCDTVDLISTLEADQTFWTYLNEHIVPMSAQEKIGFMNT